MSLKIKLVVSFLIVTLIATAVGAINIYSTNKISTMLNDINETTFLEINLLNQIKVKAVAFIEASTKYKLLQIAQANNSKLALKNVINTPQKPISLDSEEKNSEIYLIKQELNKLMSQYEKINNKNTTEKQKIRSVLEEISQHITFLQALEINELVDLNTITTRINKLESSKTILLELTEQLVSKNTTLLNTQNSKVQDIVHSSRFFSALSALIALFFSLIVGLLAANAISHPLKELDQIATNIAKGHLKNKIESHSNDELGKLGITFNQMIDYLQESASLANRVANGDLTAKVNLRSEKDIFGNALAQMMGSLRTIVLNINVSANSLREKVQTNLQPTELSLQENTKVTSNAINEMINVIEEFSTNTEAIAKNLDSQASSVQETTLTLAHMSERLNKIAKIAKDFTKLVEGTKNTVTDGFSSVDQTSKGMLEINTSIVTTAETLENLSQQAKAIGRIVEVINAISDQTNLLALNAAIEAARAGEHGLGFSVVADEVRKLSDRTLSSAQEISTLVKSIQASVLKVSKYMETSTTLVKEGLEQSAKAVTSLNQIDQMIIKVVNTSLEIEEIISEQSVGAGQMFLASQQLSEITQEIQFSSQEQASSTQEIKSAVENVRVATMRNEELVEKLNQAGKTILSQSTLLQSAVSILRVK